MILFSSRIELSFWVALFCYGVHICAFNWWDDFFDTLNHTDQSYVMSQIWVQNPQNSEPWLNCIGGKKDIFLKWKIFIERWLYETRRHVKSPVKFILIGDAQTFAYHNDLFKVWTQRYPNAFEFVFYTDVIKNITADVYSLVQEQCTHGIPAACSDFIRIASIDHFNSDFLVYMDIDTFVHRLENAKNIYLPRSPLSENSAISMGVGAVTRPGIYHGVLYEKGSGIDGNSLRMNNDFLISAKSDAALKAAIMRMAESRLADSADLVHLISMRSSIHSVQQYIFYQNQRLDLAKKNINQNFLYVPFIIFSTGPGFWKDLYMSGWSKAYPSIDIYSTGEWMDKGTVSQQASIKEFLSCGIDENRVDIITNVMILIDDYFYYISKNAIVARYIEESLRESFSALNHKEKEYLDHFFHFHFSKIQEICHV